jgi:nitroreductase
MDTFDAIYGRRSVKHFDPDHEMPEADLTKLLEAAIQAPTSFNIQHWRFVVVKDKELRAADPRERQRPGADDRRERAHRDDRGREGVEQVARSGTGSTRRHGSRRAARQLDGPLPRGPGELQRDEAQRSIGMAMQTIMLAAKAWATTPAR